MSIHKLINNISMSQLMQVVKIVVMSFFFVLQIGARSTFVWTLKTLHAKSVHHTHKHHRCVEEHVAVIGVHILVTVFLLEPLHWVGSTCALVAAGPIKDIHQCTTIAPPCFGKVKRANKSRITPFSLLTSPVPCCGWDEQKSEVQMEGRLRACQT